MTELGYAISSEEHSPLDCVRNGARAEELGFTFLGISDHFHPWVDEQGHAPFVWSVLGAIAQATDRIRIGTGVTCPTVRIHPAVIAHAAATTACLMPGRFFLGVGSGEALNEHILADRWPTAPERLDMLEEAVRVIRTLWQGGSQDWSGEHYVVENARLYDIPDQLPEIVVAAAGPKAAEVAARVGDGIWCTSPDGELLETYGQDGMKLAQATLCWAPTVEEGRRTAHRIWPNALIPGFLSTDLPTPKHFEQAAQLVTEDAVGEAIPCGPDVEVHVKAIEQYVDAGFTHVYLHQIGHDQSGFFDFCERELLPAVRERLDITVDVRG